MATRYEIDHSRMAGHRSAETKQNLARLDKIMIRVEDGVEDLFNSKSPVDKARLNDVLVLLTGEGEFQTVQPIGTTPASADAATGPTLGGVRYVPAFEHDGTAIGTGFKTEDEAIASGFEPWLEPDGTLKGFRKKAPAALPAAPGDAGARRYQVLDSKGRTRYKKGSTDPVTVSLSEGNANKGLEAVPDDSGVTQFFKEKRTYGFGA